jgi:hypothetical protein
MTTPIGKTGKRANIPSNYSIGTIRGGFTFTWKDATGNYMATPAMGAPWRTLEDVEAAIVEHAARAASS